jgi:uncharacterized protein
VSPSPVAPSSPPAASADETWRLVGTEEFVRLTTFRRTGAGVATPVWVVLDGDAMLVTTPSGSGKVKRLRHTSRVKVQPCGRRGAVEAGSSQVTGTAVVETDPHAHARVEHLFAAKYGVQYRMAMAVEKVVRTVKRRSGPARRIIRITPA